MSGLSDRLAAMRRKTRFYARKLAWVSGIAERFQTPAGPLRLPRKTVSPRIFYHLTTGDYEAAERRMLEEHLEPGDRVIELGAGLGFLANLYGRRCPDGPHLALEASPTMSSLARENTAALANLQILNAVASRRPNTGEPADADITQTVPFYVYDEFWGSSTEPLHLTSPACRLVSTVDVPIVDLDVLIARQRCTMLVCDIEGGEFDLFRNFAIDVPKILLELHWDALGFSRALSVLNTLESRGYRLVGSPEVFVALRD